MNFPVDQLVGRAAKLDPTHHNLNSDADIDEAAPRRPENA